MLTKTNNLDELYKGVMYHGPEILNHVVSDPTVIEKYLSRIFEEHLDYPTPSENINISNWLIPQSYKDLDIEEYLVHNCPEENYDRLITELALYRKYNMIPVLKAMKYIVDTLRKNNVVWGVGRGSSVSSYTLYLLGVHRIDSVKYKLPIEEFFKEI